MQSEPFERALTRVLDLAAHRRAAIMCAEAHPSRCHRRILSDAIVAGGFRVVHVLDRGRVAEHALDPNARTAREGSMVYPVAAQGELGF